MELRVLPKLGREIPRERYETVVLGVEPNGRYISVFLRPKKNLAMQHSRPGQYIVATLPGLPPRFLALASTPGAETWELLVDPTQGDLSHALEQLKAGSLLACSVPEGPGYPTLFEAFSDIIVVATGSGVASIISLLETWQPPSNTTVFYSEKAPEDFAFKSVLEEYQDRGEFDLHLLVGQRIEHLDLRIQPATTALVLCGSPQTMHLLSGHFMELGVPLEHIFTNV